MEWFWIVLIVLILFGAKKLPELARGLGRSVGEFKKAKDEFDRELRSVENDVTEVDTGRPASGRLPTPPSPASGTESRQGDRSSSEGSVPRA